MMPDQKFGPLISFADVEQGLLSHIELWIDAWLAARERKVGIIPGTIARPRSYITKQTFTALPGEDQTPCVIVVSDGFTENSERHGDSSHDIYLRMGVAAIVQGTEAVQARELAGHYQVALLGLLLKKRTVMGGRAVMNEWRDMRMDDLDEEAVGRSLSAVRLELSYCVRDFVNEYGGPETVPDVPYDPQPDFGQVQTHEEIVEVKS
jgi:hypothetical protein